jgi:integrase
MKPYLEGLHRMSIDQVTRKDNAACLLRVSKQSGEPTAIALRSALNALSDWAMQMGLAESNPVIGSFKPPKQATRDRVLDDSELAMIWRALADADYGKIIRLLILTGCRRQEIGAMGWSEFSPDMSTWTLPPSRSKTGKPHKLPVTPLMREVIASICRRDGHDNLFGRKQFTGWGIGKRALDEKLGLRPWTVHDTRRSVATGMANIGVQPHIIEQILNHQSGHKRGVAGVYNRSPYEREVRDAMLRWSDHIRAVVEGTEHKVVAFPQAERA